MADFNQIIADYYRENCSISKNATVHEFSEHIRKMIDKTFLYENYRRFRNFNIWCSYRSLGDIVVIVRPVADGGAIPGNFNPCAFLHFNIRRDNEADVIQAIRYFSKYNNYEG